MSGQRAIMTTLHSEDERPGSALWLEGWRVECCGYRNRRSCMGTSTRAVRGVTCRGVFLLVKLSCVITV